jgi:hypothetical protein
MQRYMLILAYLGSQCTQFHATGLICWFLRYIRNSVSSLMRFRGGSDSVHQIFFVNLGKSVTETLAMIIQALGEESMSLTWAFEWHARFRADRER